MRWWQHRFQLQFRQTTLIFWLCLMFLAGIGLAHTGVLVDLSWAILSGSLLIFAWRRKTVWTLLWIAILGLSLGVWRGSIYQQHLAEYGSYFGQKITLIATAGQDATYNDRKQLTFDVHNPNVVKTDQTLVGKVGLSGFGAAAVYAGDTVRVTGKLYPARGSYQARMSYGTIEVIERGDGLIPELRRRFVAGMQSALPEPLASFGMGLLIGQRANLPDEVYDSLLMVGLVHIIAVSGYNLTIILRASKGLLSKYSRRLSLLLAFGLMGLFLLFAGASASIVRAAIVSTLAILAAYYGRQVKPLVLIMLAAAITGWANPYYVWTDVGWYLSFSAFFGVMVLAPMLLVRLPKRLQGSLIAAIALESFCAELMTLPYILHIFGQMSFVALLANILVVALVPLAMLLCLIAGLAGMFLPVLAGWFAWPARLLLTYMLDVARGLSQIPHVFVENIPFSLLEMLLVYGLVGLVTFMAWHRLTKPQLAIMDRQAIGSFDNKDDEADK